MKPFKNTEILVLRFMISSSAVQCMLDFWSLRTWVVFRLSRAVGKQLVHHSAPEPRDACAWCSGQMLKGNPLPSFTKYTPATVGLAVDRAAPSGCG